MGLDCWYKHLTTGTSNVNISFDISRRWMCKDLIAIAWYIEKLWALTLQWHRWKLSDVLIDNCFDILNQYDFAQALYGVEFSKHEDRILWTALNPESVIMYFSRECIGPFTFYPPPLINERNGRTNYFETVVMIFSDKIRLFLKIKYT